MKLCISCVVLEVKSLLNIYYVLYLESMGGKWRMVGVVLNNYCERFLFILLDFGDLEFIIMTCDFDSILFFMSFILE